MRIKEIGIRNLREGFDHFKAAFSSAQERQPFKRKEGAYFTSLEAARRFLTPKRLHLLHVVKEKSPQSLYALAKCSGRSFSSVVRDVRILSQHGLIQLTPRSTAPRHRVHPEVPYDVINIWIGI